MTKAEIKKMKASHVDIGTMLRRKEEIILEEDVEPEKEFEELETEQRISRWKLKKQSWENWKFCKLTLLSKIEEMLESREPDMSPTLTTRSGWKSSQVGSICVVPDSVEDIAQQEKAISGGEEGVITLTGSVEVAAPQSNIVISQADPRCPTTEASLEGDSNDSQGDAKLEATDRPGNSGGSWESHSK